MQYILTEEELDNLVPQMEVIIRDEALEAARKKLLIVTGVKCIHEFNGHSQYGGYCDDCPCSPYAEGNDKNMNLICKLSKRYSQ